MDTSVSALKMETVDSLEMLIPVYQNTRCHIPEDHQFCVFIPSSDVMLLLHFCFELQPRVKLAHLIFFDSFYHYQHEFWGIMLH